MVGFKILRFFYNLLFLAIMPFILPFHLRKRPGGLRKKWLLQRLGFVTADNAHVWLHAVSVGEAMAARPVLRRLLTDYRVVVTTVTDTGQKVVKDFVGDNAAVFYAPLDVSFAVKRFLRQIQPRLILVMETEIWPNLFYFASKMQIPLIVINGRISSGSFKGYRRVRFFIKSVLQCGRLYCMQTATDRDRLVALGAPAERVVVTGNLKMDITPSSRRPAWMQRLKRPIIVAGSTHQKEEEIILDAFRELKEKFKEAVLIIAPRHPERFPEVEELLKTQGWDYLKRSEDVTRSASVILLDSIGELSSVYEGADLCIIGGSFVPKGGHNLFEAACWGKPILCGPFMDNFPLTDEFCKEGAAIKVSNDELYRTVYQILSDRAMADRMGKRAKSLFSKYQGAIAHTYTHIERFLKPQ